MIEYLDPSHWKRVGCTTVLCTPSTSRYLLRRGRVLPRGVVVNTSRLILASKIGENLEFMLEYLLAPQQLLLGFPGPHYFYQTRATWNYSFLVCHQGLLYIGKRPHESPIPTPEPIVAVHDSTQYTWNHVLGASGCIYEARYRTEWEFLPCDMSLRALFLQLPLYYYDVQEGSTITAAEFALRPVTHYQLGPMHSLHFSLTSIY